MNADEKYTYAKALILPFRLTPVLTSLTLLKDIIALVFAPLGVIVTAKFIDTALAVGRGEIEWVAVIKPMVMMTCIRLYIYIVNPLFEFITKEKSRRSWVKFDLPFIGRRASLKLRYFENSENMDLINRIGNSPSCKLCEIWSHFVNTVIFVCQLVSYIIIMISAAPVAGAVILLVSVPVVFAANKCANLQYQAKKDITKLQRLANCLNGFLFSRDAAAERTVFGSSEHIGQKFISSFNNAKEYMLKVDEKTEIRKSTSGFLMILFSAGVLFSLIPYVQSASVSVGMYISFVEIVFAVVSDISWNLTNMIEHIILDKKYLHDFNDFQSLVFFPDALEIISENSPPFEKLEFVNVSFRYPGTEKEILHNISFTIEKGKHYSFVGINGSGKTTIMKLILKMYDEYTGQILLNGRSLKEWSLSDIKAVVGATFQDFAHYDISLSDNIAIGSCFRSTDEEIDRAISLVGMEKVVASLPDGKNTLVGKIHENNIDFSTGQWQRIAIARTVVSKCGLKIFDEPTASLDPIAERDVFTSFMNVCKDTATISISHRLVSCIASDIIYVLDHGTIAEFGSHIELIKAKGHYATMFDEQKEWYI